MTILTRFKRLKRQYQTRKQLQNLPRYLLNDIALTVETSTNEINKNRLTALLLTAFKQITRRS